MPRELVTFRLDDTLFGLDVTTVQEVLVGGVPTAIPLAAESVAGLLNLRGQVVLAVSLRSRMNYQPLPAGEPQANVILRSDQSPVCLVVDRIAEVEVVNDEMFESPPETLTGSTRALVLGAYKLTDELLLELDVEAVLDVGAIPSVDQSALQGVPS